MIKNEFCSKSSMTVLWKICKILEYYKVLFGHSDCVVSV